MNSLMYLRGAASSAVHMSYYDQVASATRQPVPAEEEQGIEVVVCFHGEKLKSFIASC